MHRAQSKWEANAPPAPACPTAALLLLGVILQLRGCRGAPSLLPPQIPLALFSDPPESSRILIFWVAPVLEKDGVGSCHSFKFYLMWVVWWVFFSPSLEMFIPHEGILILEAAALLQDEVIAELQVPNDGSSSREGGKGK